MENMMECAYSVIHGDELIIKKRYYTKRNSLF